MVFELNGLAIQRGFIMTDANQYFLCLSNSFTGDEGYLCRGKTMWSNQMFVKLLIKELYLVKLSESMETMGKGGNFKFTIVSWINQTKEHPVFYYCRATTIPLTYNDYVQFKKSNKIS